MSLLLATCALLLTQSPAAERTSAPLRERLQAELEAYVRAARVPGVSALPRPLGRLCDELLAQALKP